MRLVQRGPCPEVLDGPASAGGKEHLAAGAFFALKINVGQPFKGFTTYKHASVREALARAFGSKCCYCESRIAHVMPSEIEHYRPKAGFRDASGKLTKPGYYWLAADWNNLLLVCIDCNRRRRHMDGHGKLVSSGKENYFPLLDESKRATEPGGEVHELPSLLDPCSDPVEAYFEFTEEGAIRPAHRSGREHSRATATIRIIGLQRWQLGKRRGELMLRVDAQIEKYREAREDYERYPITQPSSARSIERLQT